MNRNGLPVRWVLVVVGVLAAQLGLVPGVASVAVTAPVKAAATPPTCTGVDLAPPLTRDPDRNPNGSAVRISADRRGKYTPVLMVHGWTGSSTHDNERNGAFSSKIDLSANRLARVSVGRSLVGQLQGVPGTAVYTFDYHELSGRWVNDKGIGSALGAAIDCLFKATGQKVIVVGHSMGGLAARFALSERGRGGIDRATEVSQVITFGTPHQGSVAAAVIGGLVNAASWSSQQVALFRTILAGCGALSSSSIETGTLCDRLPAFLRAFEGDAGRALQAGSKELAALGRPRVPFHSLAGQTTFTVKSGWFGLPWDTRDVSLGDMIVTTGSANAGAVDNKTLRCRYQLNAVRGGVDQIGLMVGLTAANDVARQPLGSLSGPCFHGSLMRSIELTNDALSLVAEDVASRQPITVADLRAAGACAPGCRITGTVPFRHPRWGPSTLVTTLVERDVAREAHMVVLDASKRVVWQHFGGSWYELSPHQKTVDANGHLFVDYNPGRYNGVIILKPTPEGFEDFGSLPAEDDYVARFYSAEAVDLGSDGALDVHLAINICEPTCADGVYEHSLLSYQGAGYELAGNDADNTPGWEVRPGGVGPLRVGMTGQEGFAAGVAVDTPGAQCGDEWSHVGDFYDPELGDIALGTEWQAGGSASDLDGVLIKNDKFRTAEGLGVGSTRGELQAEYGGRLRSTPVAGVDGVVRELVLWSGGAALVFYLDGDRVDVMEAIRGTPGGQLQSVFAGC